MTYIIIGVCAVILLIVCRLIFMYILFPTYAEDIVFTRKEQNLYGNNHDVFVLSHKRGILTIREGMVTQTISIRQFLKRYTV